MSVIEQHRRIHKYFNENLQLEVYGVVDQDRDIWIYVPFSFEEKQLLPSQCKLAKEIKFKNLQRFSPNWWQPPDSVWLSPSGLATILTQKRRYKQRISKWLLGTVLPLLFQIE